MKGISIGGSSKFKSQQSSQDGQKKPKSVLDELMLSDVLGQELEQLRNEFSNL